MPYRRRNAKSRRRRPKARRRVDKVQDRRIARLESAVEKKFSIRGPADFRALAEVTSMTSQIHALLPANVQGVGTEQRIGNQISLKNFRCDYTLESDSPMAVRVIFFWLTVPRTWATDGTGDPPASAGVNPTWPQLLADFALQTAGSSGVPPMNNIVAQHELLTDSNKSPIIRLSDKVHYLGSPYNAIANQEPTGSERCVKKLSFVKSYKDMKLTYNDAGTAPVNRQLYMAVCSGVTTHPSSSEPLGTCYVTHASSMRYTDC